MNAFLEDECSEEDILVIVNELDFSTALARLKPSISAEELERYQSLKLALSM